MKKSWSFMLLATLLGLAGCTQEQAETAAEKRPDLLAPAPSVTTDEPDAQGVRPSEAANAPELGQEGNAISGTGGGVPAGGLVPNPTGGAQPEGSR